jgi:hypothetical protein
MNNNSTQGFGLIKFIITIAIIIVFISLLGFDLQQDVIANETVQTNFSLILDWLSNIWDNHLSSPVLHVWNNIIIGMLWEPFIQGVIQGNFVDQIQSPGTIQ